MPPPPSASAVPPAPLSHALIAQAVGRSVDGADTLDLSRQHVGHVSDDAVYELANVGREGRGVRRLALSHNLLLSLPPSFGQLHRLRYLNLKGNRLRLIPLALTSLPSLEILDLSKNALDHLPPNPGSLVSLRVLSLSHNSLRTLPGYLADFLELKVCKLEHNPLVWPPAWVLGRIGDDGREMDEREWIRDVRDFLRREPEPPAYSLRAEDDGSRADEDDGEAGGESGSSSGDEEGPDRLRRLQRLQQQRPTKHAYDAAPSTSIALTSSTMTDEDRRRLRRAGAVGPTYAVHSRDNSELSDLRGPLGSPLADEGGLGGNSSSHSGGTTEAAGGDPFRPQQQQPYAVPPAYDTTVSSSTASAPATVHDRARSPTTAIASQLPPPRSTQSPSSVVAGDGDGTRAGAHVELGPVVVDQAASGGEVQTPPSSTNTGVKTFGPNEGFQEALSPPPPSQPSLQQTTPHAQFSTFSLSAPSPTKRSFPPSSTVTQVPVAALPQSTAITAEGGASRTSPSIEPVDDRKAGVAQAGHSAPNPASAGPTSNLYGVSPRQNSTDVLSSARGSFARSSISSAGGGGGGHARHHSHHQTSTLIDGGGPGGVGGGGGGGLIGNPHHRQQYEQQHALQQAQLHAGVGVPRLGSKASAGSIHRLAFPLNGGAGGGPAFSRTAAAAAISGGSPNVAPAAGGRSGGVAGGPGAGADSATAPTAGGQLIEGSRDSYFRRLSTLPPSTIPASMPPALLTLIDGARGLLFALAQIQATLRRHPTSPLDDRFAGVLSRVLAPAAGATDSLINALDRFDSTSRRASSPPARVVRGVVEAVKANVGAYGKVIAVLIIQLKVSSSKLATNASGRPSTPSGNGAGHPFQQQRENFEDIRFTRTLLLNLYGAMGEVSHAWQTMIPVLPAVAPLLRDPNAPPRQPLAAAPQQPTNGSGPAAAGVSPQPHPGGRQTRLLSSASARGGHPMSPVPERLEGSGASASTMTPGTLDGLSPGTLPPPSRHKRGASSGEGGAAGSEGSGRDPTAVAGSTSAAPDQTETNGSGGHHRPSHSRTHSQKIQREAQQHREAQALARQQQQQQAEADSRRQGGAQTSSAAPTGGDAGPPASPEAPDLAGQLLEEAVQTGFAVWNLMENDLQWHGNSVDASHSPSRLSIAPGSATVSKPIADLLAVIALAKAHTRQLHETMRAAASSGGSSAADEQTLVEHATVFFQSVRKVAGTTRAVFESERREFRRDLKVGLGKLTRLTMESATLLHVSNLKRPGTAMSAYTYGSEEPLPPANGLYPYPPPTPTPSVAFANPYATPPAQQNTGTGMRPLALGRSRSALGGEAGGPFATPLRADGLGQLPQSTPRAGPSAFVPGHGGRGKRSIGGGPGQGSFGGNGGGRSQEGIPF